jgi:hypothetical protein
MAATTPDIIIFVVPETLTDQSKVFNVLIGDVKLAACDQDDAGALAEGIAALIEDHTTNTSGVVYE